MSVSVSAMHSTTHRETWCNSNGLSCAKYPCCWLEVDQIFEVGPFSTDYLSREKPRIHVQGLLSRERDRSDPFIMDIEICSNSQENAVMVNTTIFSTKISNFVSVNS